MTTKQVDLTPLPEEERIAWYRKAVEWVEYQADLPEIDREWDQSSYVIDPVYRAVSWLLPHLGLSVMACSASSEVQQVADHCGTAYCVAGYLGMQFDERYAKDDSVAGVHVQEFVAAKLGLDSDDADWLFEGANSATDIRVIAEQLAGVTL